MRDTFGDAGPELVREMLTEIARDLLRELRAAFAPATTAAVIPNQFAAKNAKSAKSIR